MIRKVRQSISTEENMPVVNVRGNGTSRRVWVNGKEIFPHVSQKVHNHSPDGFNWGYGGSGPAQLALGVLMEVAPVEKARASYQQFKWDVIAPLPQGKDFEININTDEWLTE